MNSTRRLVLTLAFLGLSAVAAVVGRALWTSRAVTSISGANTPNSPVPDRPLAPRIETSPQRDPASSSPLSDAGASRASSSSVPEFPGSSSLAGSATIEGRVRDAATDLPIEGATLIVSRGDDELPRSTRWKGSPARTTTDSTGSFRFDSLVAGHVELELRHDRYSIERPIEIDLQDGSHVVEAIAATPADSVSGFVIDAVSKSPLPDAEVGIPGRTTVRTDAAGHFVVDAFLRHAYSLRASAKGHATIEQAIREFPSHDLRTDVVFELPAEQIARGVVVDALGRGAKDVRVRAIGISAQSNATVVIDAKESRTDENGAFELTGLRPDTRHVLILRSKGFATLRFDFPADASQQQAVDFGILSLRAGSTLRVAVVDEHGAPRPDLKVFVTGSNRDRSRFLPREVTDPYLDLYVAEESAFSDPLGVATYDDIAPGEYGIHAMIPGTHETAASKAVVSEGSRTEEARLVVPVGLSISGVVKAKDGGTPPKCFVSVDPESGQSASGDAECDGMGRFVASALLPGPYTLTVYPYPSEDDKRAGRKFDIQVVKGVEAGRSNIVIEL